MQFVIADRTNNHVIAPDTMKSRPVSAGLKIIVERVAVQIEPCNFRSTIFDMIGQCVVDAGHDCVSTPISQLDHGIADLPDEVSVVTCPADQLISAGTTPDQGVIAVEPLKPITPHIAHGQPIRAAGAVDSNHGE